MTDAVVRGRLSGHLTTTSLQEETDRLDVLLPERGGLLSLDCLAMDSYDPDARSAFVGWARHRLQGGSKVAIVTQKPLWSMVIGAMALVSGVRMRAFLSVAEGEAWLLQEPGKEEKS